MTANEYTEPVPAVQTHCEIGDQEAPHYTIHVTVNMVCTGGMVPVVVCTDSDVKYADCYDFSVANIEVVLTLEPVN